ncbi:MAG: peptidyl-prolyl cis-trans isomerase [Clostridia bacterium]|nr:peptidyl-prolyl cis-trans isomerase [Clostridia bacterium]
MNKLHRVWRYAALLLALALTLPSLISCALTPIEPTEEELAVVGKIGNYDVHYDELRFLTVNFKAELEKKYGEGIWDNPETAAKHRDELKELVYDSIVSDYYAVLALADDYYVGGSSTMLNEEEILNAVQADVEATAEEQGGNGKYKSWLSDNAFSDRLYRFYTATDHCAQELLFVLVSDLGIIPDDDKSIKEYMHSDKFLRTNHVYISDTSENGLALAERLRGELAASDDPATDIILMKGRYCDDWTMTTTHGKYFARYSSDLPEEYELAAFELDEGEVSKVVTTDSGYYVILRLEVEEAYLTAKFDDFKDDILGSEFNKMLKEYLSKMEFVPNEYGASLDLVAIS